MKSDINDLCEAFLAALTNAGYAVKSIENYKQVSNRFKKFCAENGYDTYTVNIGQIFADNVFNEETGAFVGYRNVMYGRFVRLINSFYLQGTFDFSMVTKEKNSPKSIHLIEIYQDYMEHLKTQYSNIGTIGFFQNGMLHLLTDSNLNHTGIYLYSKGKIMIHLTFDYKTDEKCTTPGQYLKYHRTFQGFTTRELAEKVGIVPATLVLYENDRHPIKHSTAVALANALGIDRNRLLDKYTAFVDYPYSTLLKKVRQELSLTQMQMAEVIGIGQTSYSGWEREIRVPRRKEYEKILAALKKLKVNADTYLCNPAST